MQDFKAFALKGNVVDMAVGVVVGGAFGKIVTSLVNDLVMPLLSLLTGGTNVSGMFLLLKEAPEGTVVDSLLGPEMRSTGEVMGIDKYFDTAFAKSQAAANSALPTAGKIFVSVANRDKRAIIMPVKLMSDLGFEILSTGGTAEVLRRNGITATTVRKVSEGTGPNGEGTVADLITAGEIHLVVNTPSGGQARGDGYEIRAAATSIGCPVVTTVSEFGAAVQAIEAMRSYEWDVTSLQEHAAKLKASAGV